jgi:hypothetical protein
MVEAKGGSKSGCGELLDLSTLSGSVPGSGVGSLVSSYGCGGDVDAQQELVF